MILRFFFIFLFFLNQIVLSQVLQTVKGRVVDKETGIGLPGAIVQLKVIGSQSIVVANNDGFYKFINVPVGRQSFLFSFSSYKTIPINDIIITSGKEMVINVELEENAIKMDEVEVKASSEKDLVNTMQMGNMKSFSIEETERYAGSRQDPARMAQNFAGVQGTNDSRNDIVIRGNSPAGLLWRLEDIDIPNPNHFAVAGSAGGPQSIINNKYLSNSEFYTGAFPANYGNALGGVFDLKMRNGNNDKHERTFQLGILGTELALEGPISKKSGASYLVSYRYSTLALFGSFNINLGTSAIPNYQDIGIRLNFPTKKLGVFSFNAIGGLSNIAIVLSKIKERPKELYGDQNRDQYFTTNMGVVILNHVYTLNSRTIMKTSLAFAAQSVGSNHYLVIRDKNFKPNDTLPHILNYDFAENKSTLAWFIKSKLNSKNSIKLGVFVNRIDVNFNDSLKLISAYNTVPTSINNKKFKSRIDSKENFYLIQPYLNFVHKFNDKTSLNTGVFSQFLTLNNKFVFEPRVSLRHQISSKHMLNLSYGIHSQMQSTYLYFAIPDSIIQDNKPTINTNQQQSNKDLDFSKSQHLVFGYDYFVTSHFKLKTELYYQYLWNVPVYQVPSSVSAINRGATFTRFFPIYTMQNTGTGYNYGLELTLEKLYYKHYFFMLSGSLFESKYKASNGKTANTDFNGNYMCNFLGGLEYAIGKNKKNSLSVGTKFTYGGGKRYSPVNLSASNAVMDIVAEDDKVNTLQFPAYNRLDLRISYKINGKKVGTEIALDLVNILNTKNILALSYSPDPANRLNKQPWAENYQLGRLPLFYVKFDF